MGAPPPTTCGCHGDWGVLVYYAPGSCMMPAAIRVVISLHSQRVGEYSVDLRLISEDFIIV